MSKSYTYYKPGTGEIVATSTGLTNEPSLAAFSVIDGEFPGDKFYIGGDTAKPRREFGVRVQSLGIYEIPPNTTLSVNGSIFVITDGHAEFTRPGSLPLHITLTHPNYLTKEIFL
jgi:hypothetical protein